jgi:hypothetical protein
LTLGVKILWGKPSRLEVTAMSDESMFNPSRLALIHDMALLLKEADNIEEARTKFDKFILSTTKGFDGWEKPKA